jgi:hypothetical protein
MNGKFKWSPTMGLLTRQQVKYVSALTLGLCFVFFQNCGGAFETLDMTSIANSSGALGTVAGAFKQNPFVCSSASVQSVSSLKRMNRIQYANNLKSLVGAATQSQMTGVINTLYEDSLKKNVKDFSNTITDNQMSAYQSIAENVYVSLKGNPSAIQQLGGACFQTTSVTAACRDSIIQNLGLHAFRRPLTPAEVTSWATDFFAMGENPSDSVALTVYAMMLSPDFLLRFELGDANSADATTYNVTPYEVASRISYGLMDSPPDDALYAAAAAGQLSTLAQVQIHVDRLLQTPEAKAKVRSFFTYWLDPRRYSNFAPDFLQGLDVNGANDEFARELGEYVDNMVFNDRATFQDLILSQKSFARTAAVAAIYGHAPVTGTTAAMSIGDRKGLLMRTPVIANDGNETHPILRGVKFRNRFLCESFGIPSGINTNDPTFFSDTARAHYSTRDRTAGITAGVSCMGCHSAINPVGFAFENFDSLGRVRKIESAFGSDGKLLAQYPVRTDSPSVNLGVQNISVRDGAGLVDSMMQENVLPGCFVRQVSRFYRTQQETAEDACYFGSIYENGVLKPGTPVVEVFRQQFLNANIFKRRMQ